MQLANPKAYAQKVQSLEFRFCLLKCIVKVEGKTRHLLVLIACPSVRCINKMIYLCSATCNDTVMMAGRIPLFLHSNLRPDCCLTLSPSDCIFNEFITL